MKRKIPSRLLDAFKENAPFVNESAEVAQVHHDPQDIIKAALTILGRISTSHDLCLDMWGPSAILGTQIIRNAFESAAKRGAKIRLITEISAENLANCEAFSSFAEVRHLDRVMGNFSVSDGRWYTASAVTVKDRPPERLIVSNVREIAHQHQYFFETLWERGTTLDDRIREIDEGHDYGDISVIRNPGNVLDIYRKLVRDAQKEIMILFPSQRAIMRQFEAGIFDAIAEALVQREGSLKVRLIVPHQAMNSSYQNLFRGLLAQKDKNVSIRSVGEVQTGTKATVAIADTRVALMMEQRDDSAETFEEAIGLSTLSESRPGVLSYASIFESLWIQTELYDQVKQANEQLEMAYDQLKEQDKIQKEFINIAAHELRTPVQPLLGMADILAMESAGKEDVQISREELDLIIRNSKRLERLSSDILQVTRIESNRLELHKERANLSDEIRNVIKDTHNSLASSGRRLQINFTASAEPIEVQIDRPRIFEVLSNLLDNAAKFTPDGSEISVSLEMTSRRGSKAEAMVKVIDSGSGIDQDILPRLFTKFATKSDRGTGLGLYISKSIVNAHGGRIWAENNANRIGAKFTFTLPLAEA